MGGKKGAPNRGKDGGKNRKAKNRRK